MNPPSPKVKNRVLYAAPGSFSWSYVSFACAVIVLVGGYFFLQHIAQRIDQADRDELLTRVQTIAQVVNGDDIAALTGTESDLTSPAYHKVKNILYGIHDLNSQTRFVYFMRSSPTYPNKLIFLADSESPSSTDYSPPGQVYEDTSPLEMQNYTNAVSFTEGPYTDAWGTWVSGYAPIWSHGHLAGIVGMDITASRWQNQDQSFQIGLMVISLFAGFGFILIGFYIRRTVRCAEENRTLKEHIINNLK